MIYYNYSDIRGVNMDSQKLLWNIGTNLYKARKEKGYTQQQLAEMIGVTEQTISNAENGGKAMRPENIAKICKVLGISADYLLFGTENRAALSVSEEEFAKLTPEQRESIRQILDNCLKMCKQ